MSAEKNEINIDEVAASTYVSLLACDVSETENQRKQSFEASPSTSKSSCSDGQGAGDSMPRLHGHQLDSNKFNSIKKHLFGWKNKKRKARGRKSSLNVWDENYRDDVLINFTKQSCRQGKNGSQDQRDGRNSGMNDIDFADSDCAQEDIVDGDENQMRQRLLSDNGRKLVEIVKHNNNIDYRDCDISAPSSSDHGKDSNSFKKSCDTNARLSNDCKTLTNGCDQNSKCNLVEKCKKDIFHHYKRRKMSTSSFKQESESGNRSNESLLNEEYSKSSSNLKCSKSFHNVNADCSNNNNSVNLKRNISVGDDMFSKDTIVCFNEKCLSSYIQTKVYKRHSSDNLLNSNLLSILCNSSKSVSNGNRRKSKMDYFLKSLLALTTGKKLASNETENRSEKRNSKIHSSSAKKVNSKGTSLSSPNSLSMSFSELHSPEKTPFVKNHLCKSCSDINYVISSTPYVQQNRNSFSNLKFIDSDCSSSCILNNSVNSNQGDEFSDSSSPKASSLLQSSKSALNLRETDKNVYEILENKCSSESLADVSSRNCVRENCVSCVACIEKTSAPVDPCCRLTVPPYRTSDNGAGSARGPSESSYSRRPRKSRSVANVKPECEVSSSGLSRPQSVVLADTSFSCVSNYRSAVKSAQDLCSNSHSDISGNLSSSHSHQSVLPVEPVNRLRVPSVVISGSKFFSTCSSLLSLASSSRYSISSSAAFIPVKDKNVVTVLCKVCLNEVELKDSWTLQQCNCTYCVACVRAYVEFEINQGAYHISCPDAQCKSQGIIQMEEIESLVNFDEVEKHKRFKLNKEVELDKSRVWCPRAGCETVCTLNSTVERTIPQCVHCPTCSSNFCSNCRASWHAGTPCRQEDLQPAIPGVSFDSELIKCCPMCSVPIEKDEGCAQMMCKRCKHVFCWYCLASLDDDFLLRHYDKGPCKNKLGHSRASVIWHRTQVIGIFAGFGILLLIASPLLLLAAPCIICCKCRVCTSGSKLDGDDLPEDDLT